jgi:hypothetical protein
MPREPNWSRMNGTKGAALFVAVGTVLADFCTGPGIQRLARFHVLVGGSMYIDAREIKQEGCGRP